ncbi:cytochrome b [Streptomyces sp. P6-2-1]|uniref:cytochrome b n=1 Tax=Streptomyces sp. P6-2-1 TaxID=3422591 RepID=UPI003D36DB0C
MTEPSRPPLPAQPGPAITLAPGPSAPARFDALTRWLHWIMALLVTAALFTGIALTRWLSDYDVLSRVHQPLGAAVLVLAVVRLVNRLVRRTPPYPPAMPRAERLAATASECALYALLLAQPLAGWAMQSAAGIPVPLYGSAHLPALIGQDYGLYSTLHTVHEVLGYTLLGLFVAHVTGTLTHTLVTRDKLLRRVSLRR